jgi:hypothetical protein
VLLFSGLFSSVRLPNSQDAKRLITGVTLATLALISSAFFIQASGDVWMALSLTKPGQHVQWQVADRLHQLGIEPGERVAILGGYMFPEYHWARLARVKIVAEVIDRESFWAVSPQVRAEVFKAIEETGARAIVQKPGTQPFRPARNTGWKEIDDTGYYVYFFDRAKASS